MASRPVYYPIDKPPYVSKVLCSFEYNPGFSITQARKNIINLHNSYRLIQPNANLLEISRKSPNEIGIALSAFNLKVKLNNNRSISVECLFQSSKVFEFGGPFLDLLDKSSKEAKQDPRLKSSGDLIKFNCFGNEFPLEPKTGFYNWLYLKGLCHNPELAKELLAYDAFTDIVFNPKKQINSQAEAAALFVSLYKNNLLKVALSSVENYYKVISGDNLFNHESEDDLTKKSVQMKLF